MMVIVYEQRQNWYPIVYGMEINILYTHNESIPLMPEFISAES